jgi:hypothetical protein
MVSGLSALLSGGGGTELVLYGDVSRGVVAAATSQPADPPPDPAGVPAADFGDGLFSRAQQSNTITDRLGHYFNQMKGAIVDPPGGAAGYDGMFNWAPWASVTNGLSDPLAPGGSSSVTQTERAGNDFSAIATGFYQVRSILDSMGLRTLIGTGWLILCFCVGVSYVMSMLRQLQEAFS